MPSNPVEWGRFVEVSWLQLNGDWMRAGRRCALPLLLVLASEPRALCLDSNRTIEQFFHTAWLVGEGAPSGLTRIAQTTDGYLWLGTQTGLVRFDGVRFDRDERVNAAFPSTTVSALLATSDGGLWVGFVPSSAAFLKAGRVVIYTQKEGLPTAPVLCFGEDGEGNIWIGTTRGAYQLEGNRWRAAGSDQGLPDASIENFFLDRDGGFWVSTIEGLFRSRSHASAFDRQPGESAQVGQGKDGTIWNITGNGRVERMPGAAIDMNASRFLIDRDQSMWILRDGTGLARVADLSRSTVIESFTQTDGLSDNRAVALLEDREGNIWVATRGGLDRFRARTITPAPFPYGDGDDDLALAAGPDGAIWAGNRNQPLRRLRGNDVSTLGGNRRITCAYRAPDGTLIFGSDNEILRVSGDRIAETTPFPRQIDPTLHWAVQSITADRSGALWISIEQSGVFRLDHGVWIQWGGLAALPKRTAVVLWTDKAGNIWFGYTGDLAARWDGSTVQTFSSSEGLAVGTVTAIGGTQGHVWIGGQFGLAAFDGARFHRLAATGAEFRGISGIVETPNGDLWLNEAPGVLHINATEAGAALRDPQHALEGVLLDFRDGVPGSATAVRPLPSAILAGDGRIWISGTRGVAWIDPARIYRNPLPPPVSIEAVFADGREYDPFAAAKLPSLPSNLRVDYTALSLSMPERVRFRYRLEGFEKEWQEAGNRRSAFYGRLPPGRYRFHVIASNNDGVWNEEGASMDLIVPPAFFQTAWFAVVCASAGGGLLWALYLLRLRHVTGQLRTQMTVRLSERERIARELHDTLLQGVQGMILRFQAAANQIPRNDPARRTMEDALDRADQVMTEGRDRVRGLRANAEGIEDLSQALSFAGEELARDNSQTSFRMSVDGEPRELHPLVRDEVYRIGREALINAFMHASARTIEAALTYKNRELQLRLRDDGRGIEPEVLNAGSRPGHWGLPGMRERARRIGARLSINSRAGAGTEIDVRIPAAVAYRGRADTGFFRWQRRAATKEID